ncbi:MAG: 3-oxoacyl-[acyl-carrier-protein] reductase [Lachnospiraceae bacterium]|nr:3-oxoacyl-[acyl-carrier-protein] reductase [Lachnospiraceae bacterium]
MSDKKTALVTGGSRGIGRAISLKLAADGYFVIINCSGSTDKAEMVKQEIEAAGGEACVRAWDVSSYTDTEAAMKEIIKSYGRLDVLVNNAGVTKDGLLMQMKEEAFDRVLDVNLKGTFNTIRFASRQMLKQRSGRIVNLSSVVALRGNAGQVNYSASKAGIIGLTKSAAKELASRGITINAVAPGFIETEMTAVLSEEVKKSSLENIPLGRMGQPEDIAGAVAFLVSDAAAYITGQVLCVDGGMAM